MANQLHVAHSASIMGAGLVAGGLYGCAVDRILGEQVVPMASLATGRCMSAPTLLPPAAEFAQRIRAFAGAGWIDPVANIQRARLYAFTGRSDRVVNPAVVRRGVDVYQALGLNAAAFRDDLNAGHSWVTLAFGLSCDANADPYINNCDYDQAGQMLATIYGPLQPRAAEAGGSLLRFDQKEFASGGETAAQGLWDTGYLYVPAACAPAATDAMCRLHVVLHGCRQSVQVLGDEFVRRIGVNEWADGNRIVVLYPQARAINVADLRPPRPTDLFNINPEGCWNWWGYAYDTRYLFKDGRQISAIWAMIQRVTSRSNQ